ncbi:Mismatch repair-related protein [Mycena indigotica]|uniref:Mismatch repair-related protein n=1 Tax=Mycena indigotica TaxID=2126181 RepID=A0A8H6SQ98_9AGAR|nr:Mismatch repair-related protein [Mycena indigotica]KAF7302005.1 Mismatch repair-related protein [Mycena indigotica]
MQPNLNAFPYPSSSHYHPVPGPSSRVEDTKKDPAKKRKELSGKLNKEMSDRRDESRQYTETVNMLQRTATQLAHKPESVPLYELRLLPLSIERSSLLVSIELEERHAIDCAVMAFEEERQRVEEEYKRGRDRVRERLLEGIEERRRRAREDREGEGTGGDASMEQNRPHITRKLRNKLGTSPPPTPLGAAVPNPALPVTTGPFLNPHSLSVDEIPSPFPMSLTAGASSSTTGVPVTVPAVGANGRRRHKGSGTHLSQAIGGLGKSLAALTGCKESEIDSDLGEIRRAKRRRAAQDVHEDAMDAIEPLPDVTRSKLRSTQILTSLSQIVSELLQNSLDAGARQVDIGVDCEEWTCWVRDDGCGMSKEGLDILNRGLEAGRYGTSKAYTLDSLNSLSTFGFRGEALASCGDICCLEIASRTAHGKETWSVIIKGSKSLYKGPAVRWRRESSGTTVCIRDAFYNLPVRRLSHASPARTMDAIRRQIETFALVFPQVSFSLKNIHNAKDDRDMVLRVPKTTSTLTMFRHLYGRALVQHVEEVDLKSDGLRFEGFISLDGAQSKAYQFLYINRHPISLCDLHHVIDVQFASSSFSKHAYEEDGETSVRNVIRRSPRKTEKRAVYVINITVPPQNVDNCLEPAKAVVHIRNKTTVVGLLIEIVRSFLLRHGFTPHEPPRPGSPSPRKRHKLEHESFDDSGYAEMEPPSTIRDLQPSRYNTPEPFITREKEHEVLWSDPNTGHVYVINTRTGNSYKQSDPPQTERATAVQRRTLSNQNVDIDNMPEWIQQALEANNVFAVAEKRIPHLTTPGYTHEPQFSDYLRQGADPAGSTSYRFKKSDLQNARVIEQIDRKFVACLIDDTLVLIDQHAADERIRVERFLKELCLGYLANAAHKEHGGIKTRKLDPPLPVLVTCHEASHLAKQQVGIELSHWGFGFVDTGDKPVESSGYTQVFVDSLPEVVADKLLMDSELRDFIKGFLGRIEDDPFTIQIPPQTQESDDEFSWLNALRCCPQQLLDLVNSKACRGAIMFNDPLTITQCRKLVDNLAKTAFPFQCAHGRPSLAPLIDLVLWPILFPFVTLVSGVPRPTDLVATKRVSIKSERSWLWGWAFGAESTVSVVDRSPIVSFASRPAAFGAEINDPILGYVIPLSSFTAPCEASNSSELFVPPNNACPRLCISGPHRPDPSETWIALVQRGGGCEFVRKVREAQRLGARAVVVGGEDPEISGYPDVLVNMYSPEDASDVKIASTFIRYSDYITLFNLILASSTSHDGLQTLSLLITAEYSAWEWYSPIITFIVILLLPSALTFITLLVHRIRAARAAQRERAPEEVVHKLPWRVWTGSGWEKHESGEDPYAETDPSLTQGQTDTEQEATDKPNVEEGETSNSSQSDPSTSAATELTTTAPLPWFDQQLECAICLSEFEKGDKVRVLPCHHIFHLAEVDEWLIQRKKLCPVCKADVTQPPADPHVPSVAASSSEDATERTPLLENPA